MSGLLPFALKITPAPAGGDRTVKQKWTVEYFIPHELHAEPYAPSAEEVNVLKFPQMDVWVKVFGGYAKEEDVINQAFDFFDELDKAGIKVRTDLVGVAFYVSYDQNWRCLLMHLCSSLFQKLTDVNVLLLH
eukprot:1140937-Pelagomonas_calceolata.AAC.1